MWDVSWNYFISYVSSLWFWNIHGYSITHFLLKQLNFYKDRAIRISFYLPKRIFFLYHLHLEIQDIEKPWTQNRENTNTSQLHPEFEYLVHVWVKNKNNNNNPPPPKKNNHNKKPTTQHIISISWNFRETKYYTLYILIKRIVQQTLSYENYNNKLLLKRLTKTPTMYSSIWLCSHFVWCPACSSISALNYHSCLVWIWLCSYCTCKKVFKRYWQEIKSNKMYCILWTKKLHSFSNKAYLCQESFYIP